MFEDNDDKNIDWDKLMAKLDGEHSMTDYTEEELRMLAAAREMKTRMAQSNFSVDEGWRQFSAARSKRRIVRMLQLVAAAVVVALGACIWMLQSVKHSPQQGVQLATTSPSGKVQLKLADGRAIQLGADTQTIQGGQARIHVDATKLAYAANNTGKVVTTMDELQVPRGLQFSLLLADGTQVWLNAGTTLRYPAVFNGAAREVFVEGEAYFDVKPNVTQPFIVHAGNNELKVLGTSFNVNTFDMKVTTTLSTGRLMVTAAQQQRLLNPGEQVVCDAGNLEKQEVDTHIYTAWKDGELFFEDSPLVDITRYLARNYDYDFEFKDTSLEKLRFTLDMRRPAHLQDALDLITKSMGTISFRVHNKTVQVDRLFE